MSLFFTAAAAWPFLEQWITGDRTEQHVTDRPRDAAARTGIGVAVITFYGILWAEGADDIIANYLHIPLELITQIARYAVLAGPVAAYLVTKRICLGLQRKDLHLLKHGVETGIIRRLPSGAYVEESRPLTQEAHAAIKFRRDLAALSASRYGASQDVPPRGIRSSLGRARARLNHALTESVPPQGHGRQHTERRGPAVPGRTRPCTRTPRARPGRPSQPDRRHRGRSHE